MFIKDLEKEGWITSQDNINYYIKKDEIDELVFHAWGMAMKLNNKKLKNNKYLVKRVKETDFNKVFEKRQQRMKNNRKKKIDI